MPFILRPRGTCPASGHRITNSVKAIVCATANTPASVRERNNPSLITLLIALSHKLNRAISAPARQCIKMPTVPAKEVFFRFKHKPTVTFSPDYHSLSLPQSVRHSPPVFERRAVILHNGYSGFYKIASAKVAVKNATKISLFAFRRGRSSV